jgi:hypothetical protein
VFPKEGSFSDVRGKNTRRSVHLLVGATLIIATSVVGSFLTSSLTGEQSLWSRLGWVAAGIGVTFFYLRWQLRSQEGSLEAIKERVSQLEPELRKQVQARSYGARRQLIPGMPISRRWRRIGGLSLRGRESGMAASYRVTPGYREAPQAEVPRTLLLSTCVNKVRRCIES